MAECFIEQRYIIQHSMIRKEFIKTMETINKQHLTYQAIDELTNTLLSYRQTSYESGTETKVNLIVKIGIPDNQDFIKITFLDHTSIIVWLDNGQLPKINYKEDTRPVLPILSLSSFTEKILNTIIRAFYNIKV